MSLFYLYEDIAKYRLVLESGRRFVEHYLLAHSERESADDYARRKQMTYCPAFAKSALKEIKNTIYSVMPDIIRQSESATYMQAQAGEGMGVDHEGRSMSAFIAKYILIELMGMGKVGVLVDRDQTIGSTRTDRFRNTPKLIPVHREHVQELEYNDGVLIRAVLELGEDPKLPKKKYEYVLTPDSKVDVFSNGSLLTTLDMPRIPFEYIELEESLLVDAADIQISLLQLVSSDMSYTVEANFPFYIEQVNRLEAAHLKRDDTQEVGIRKGRRYQAGLDAPGFINPSSEPLEASMKKQEQLKQEIREVINLAASNAQARHASADSKSIDNQGKINGLAAIGAELAVAERNILHIWELFEGLPPNGYVEYPKDYNVQSTEARNKEAEELSTLRKDVPSKTFQREVTKLMVKTLLQGRVPLDKLEDIYKEVDKAQIILADPETLRADFEAGFLDGEGAANARLYPAGTFEKAKVDHAERLARIAESQSDGASGARGTDSTDHDSGKLEKQNVNRDTDPDNQSTQRGKQNSPTQGDT